MKTDLLRNESDNPFFVQTPEEMSARDIIELYVPVPAADELGINKHVFLHGHRGCGKSMVLRRMASDCQMLLGNCELRDLQYFGVYLSIKKTGLDVSDYDMLGSESVGIMFSEHALVCHLSSALFRAIYDAIGRPESSLITETDGRDQSSGLLEFYESFLHQILVISGLEEKYLPKLSAGSSLTRILQAIIDIFDISIRIQNSYFRRSFSSLSVSEMDYDGPLLGFHEFLVPMVERVQKLSFFPSKPAYFIIDDADNLNLLQTKVLNTWVSYRTNSTISFKIATQMRYKTYNTLSNVKIENPHDYTEFNASNVHIGSPKDDSYYEWVYQVIKKRLFAYYGEEIDPVEYFPSDERQDREIEAIAEEYKEKWKAEKGRGARANDDAYRYARPEYMTRISRRKQGPSKYVYSGFRQLVHISSGIIRLFLDPAGKMYALEKSTKSEVRLVPPSTQDKIIRETSDYILFSDFEKRLLDINDESSIHRTNMIRLRNLIITIGTSFRGFLLDQKRSERRVFSFAISDYENMGKNLQQILDLGVQEGYLYESFIGTKQDCGRTKLFVLNRRLAPYFKLDPIGFSSYKFVTCAFLLKASQQPKTIINKIETQGIDSVLSHDEQLMLEFDNED